MVDVEDISEPRASKDREDKRKNKPEVATEKLKKKSRIIALAKRRGDEHITDICMLPENEAGVCVLHAGVTIIDPEAERKIKDLEQKAKIIFPQLLYVWL